MVTALAIAWYFTVMFNRGAYMVPHEVTNSESYASYAACEVARGMFDKKLADAGMTKYYTMECKPVVTNN